MTMPARDPNEAITVNEALRRARERNASDLHVADNRVAQARISKKMTRIGGIVSAEEISKFIEPYIKDKIAAEYHKHGDFSVAEISDSGNIRIQCYNESGGRRLVIRLLPADAYRLEKLNLPAKIGDFVNRAGGLIIVCGPTTSGKTTTVAAMIDRLISVKNRNIYTVEDPIEIRFHSDDVVVCQREVGVHCQSYTDAVRAAMRGDPNVIVCGEVRTKETAEAVIDASETGNLVICTLHSGDAVQAIERMIGLTDNSLATRNLLAQQLIGVIALRLVPGISATEPVIPAVEVLVVNDAVRNNMKLDNRGGIRDIIARGRAEGMMTLEAALTELVRAKRVSIGTAKAIANRPDEVTV